MGNFTSQRTQFLQQINGKEKNPENGWGYLRDIANKCSKYILRGSQFE